MSPEIQPHHETQAPRGLRSIEPKLYPQLAREVQKSVLEIDALLGRMQLTACSIEAMFEWRDAVAAWRLRQWDVANMLPEAGFQFPVDIMLIDLNGPGMDKFVIAWRAHLVKLWPFIDPHQELARHQSMVITS